MAARTRKLVILSVKLLVAAGLLAWVFSRVHWHDYVVDRKTGRTYAVMSIQVGPDGRQQLRLSQGLLWWRTENVRPAEQFVESNGLIVRPGFAATIKNVRIAWMLVGTLGFLGSVLIISVRWWLLLRMQGIRISRLEAVRLTFLGYFFSLVVPGTVGGDVVKAYYASKHTDRKAAALLSIFVDRVLGLAGMTGLATLMVLIVLLGGLAGGREVRLAVLAVAIIICVVSSVLVLLFSQRTRRFLRLERFYGRLSIAHHFDALGRAAVVYGRRPGLLARAVVLTIAAQLTWITGIAIVGASLSLPIETYRYFLYIPITYIIGAVPISPGGVGVIESLYVKFFAVGTIGASQVLALAMLARLIPMIWTLPGLMVALGGTKMPATRIMRQQLDLDAEKPCESQRHGDA